MSESTLTREIKQQIKEQFEPVIGFRLYEEVLCKYRNRIDIADRSLTYGFEIKISKSDCYTGNGQNFDSVGFGYFVSPLSICGFVSKLIKKNPNKYEYVGLIGYDEETKEFTEIIEAKWNPGRCNFKNTDDLTGFNEKSESFRNDLKGMFAELFINKTVDVFEDFKESIAEPLLKLKCLADMCLDPDLSDLEVSCERKDFNLIEFYEELNEAVSKLESLFKW